MTDRLAEYQPLQPFTIKIIKILKYMLASIYFTDYLNRFMKAISKHCQKTWQTSIFQWYDRKEIEKRRKRISIAME